MKRLIICEILLLLSVLLYARKGSTTAPLEAGKVVHTSMNGTDTVSAHYMRKWHHRSDLIEYLEAMNDHTIVEMHSLGGWWQPDRLSVAVEGLACQLTRYEIDGVRVDDVFQPGSTQFVPNMEHHHLLIDTYTGMLRMQLDTLASDYVEATYNFGRITDGEPMPGTASLINITHDSPMQSSERYRHVNARRHLLGAGQLDGAFTIHDKDGNGFRQHLFAAYGKRAITRENQCALIEEEPYYHAPYYKVQLDGLLPMKPNHAFNKLGYRLNAAGQTDAGSTYLYNYNEVYDLKNYTAQIYALREGLALSATWATNVSQHADPSFRRNIIDQDGESFEPWIADGVTHTLSLNARYTRSILPWLNVHAEAMNTLYMFRPTNQSWQNIVYLEPPTPDFTPAGARDLYRYEWESRAFNGGLLENRAGIDMHYSPNSVLSLSGRLDVTLDAILLNGKSKVTPNMEALFGLDIHPCNWFEMGFNLGHLRTSYTSDHLRYLSDDYLNARIYRAGTDVLLSTTGGRYRSLRKGLWQTGYMELDIPIRFHFGRHELVLQQSYKKYYNMWCTRYDVEPSAYGYYKVEQVDGNELNVFYENDGEKRYQVGYTESFGDGLVRSTPYYFSQLSRYTYTGKKVLVSLSWQSMQCSGYCGLGNGPNSNSNGILTDQTANPNTRLIVRNPGAQHPGVSRMDLDKGYVLRFYLSYNICQWVQVGLTTKWTDGKPFSAYRYREDNGQVAILPLSSRGTNPTDNNFGTRHCANWNIDLHVQGQWSVRDYPMRLRLECYNIWDFCCDQAEMAFVQDIPAAERASMVMNVPTGLKLTYTCGLTPQKKD